MNADDPRHGTNAGYCAGCRNDCCRRAHMIEIKRWRMGNPRMIDATGTRRRIEALEAIGWSRREQSRMLGRNNEYIGKVARMPVVRPATAAAVAALYERMSMVVPADPPTRPKGHIRWHEKTRRQARIKGYAPPLAWDDIDNDETPRGMTAGGRTEIDPVLVDRILGGEWHLGCTPEEKTAVCERWDSQGGSLSHLERLTGWRVWRYYRKGEAA